MTCVLSVDLGTSAVKAGVIDGGGTMLGGGTAEYSLSTPQPDRVECKADVYWASLQRAVGRARERAIGAGVGDDPAAICISSQGETLLCLDAELEPLRPAIVWLDNRAAEEARLLSERFDDQTIYERTGQLEAKATWPATKLLWLARHEPRVFESARWFVLLEDWLIGKLTGQVAAETSLWTTSLLLDIGTGGWWPAMLDHLDLDPSRLPPLAAPSEEVGTLLPAIAERLGLPGGIPVIAGGLDFILAATAAGNVRPGIATELTGTVLASVTCVDEQLTDRSGGVPIYRHVVPGKYCPSPYSQTGGLVLRWLRDNLYGPPGRHSEQVDFEAVVAEAAAIAPGADGVLMLPHLAGAWYPEFDLSAKAAVVGLTLAHGRGHLVRAALESVAYMLRLQLEGLASLGVEIERVISLGPSAESLTWRQIKADVTGEPLERIRCREASLLGAAAVAAVGIGLFDDLEQASAGMGETLDRVEPDPSNAPMYERRFGEYRQLYGLLKPTFTDGGAP